MRLLVDKNGDGVISDNETGADVMDSWNSTVSAGQTFSSGTMDDEGNEEPAEYNVAFTIPEEQTNGPIAWRFTVYNTANENIYYQVSGISLYKGDEEDGEAVIPEVKVLQIVSDDKKDTAVNLESSNAELFKKYAKLDDYKINVTTITLSEYLKHFAEVNASDYKGIRQREHYSRSREIISIIRWIIWIIISSCLVVAPICRKQAIRMEPWHLQPGYLRMTRV